LTDAVMHAAALLDITQSSLAQILGLRSPRFVLPRVHRCDTLRIDAAPWRASA
jgi:hypothetical protein